jgi:acetyl-CoA carboxylase carboxyltransferase component
MSWKAEADDIAARRKLAEGMGGPEAIERQHAQGRLTVRERIESLTDRGSFQEVGKLAGKATYENGKLVKAVPAPYVGGLASIDGRPVAIGGEDFTVRGGSSWGSDRRKGGQGGFVEDLAHQYRIPLVNLCDGAGGTVTSAKRRGYTTFPGVHSFGRSVQLLSEVPVVSAVLGTAAGGPAGRAILSHWSVMVKGSSQIFAAGPPVVERSLGHKNTKEELGGAEVAVKTAGTIDNAAESEQDCFDMIRRYLSFMPQNVWQLPPVIASGDDPDRREEELLTIVPRNRRQPYNMRKLLEMVADKASTFEIQPLFARAVITTLGRLDGKVVGFVANNPMINGGAMDAKSAKKQAHFIQLCDTFHIPLVFLVDVPGFMVGLQAEQQATLREGMRCLYIASQATVPMLTVVIRKCYGMAGMATTDREGLDLKIAWPSAEWGSLPVEGGAAAAFRREIAAAPDPKHRLEEIEAELRAFSSPLLTAEAFAVEDVIDPRETRSYLCKFINAMQARMSTSAGMKMRSGVAP